MAQIVDDFIHPHLVHAKKKNHFKRSTSHEFEEDSLSSQVRSSSVKPMKTRKYNDTSSLANFGGRPEDSQHSHTDSTMRATIKKLHEIARELAT